MRRRPLPHAAGALLALLPLAARAQGAPPNAPPPAVGVVKVELSAVNQASSFLGRIAAIDHVALVARVTAFLEQRLFVEGSEVKAGQVLYVLEQPPFQATVQAQQAAVQQAEAQLTNANITLRRAQTLLRTPAGQQSTVDDAMATSKSDAGALLAGQANLKTAQINLGYTVVRAPIDGQISATNINRGNVVGPSSGTLATIVSQDPMYVTFPVPVPTALELQQRYASQGGFSAVKLTLQLPNGTVYGATGKVDYVSPTVNNSTDTLTFRGVVPNPVLPGMKAGTPGDRGLIDGEFVNVQVQGVAPIKAITVPLASVLQDQTGPYVYTVGAGNKVAIARIALGGEVNPTTAIVLSGLTPGETVIADGLQKARPGQAVSPSPAPPLPQADSASFEAGSAAATEGTGVTPFAGQGGSGPPASTGPASDSAAAAKGKPGSGGPTAPATGGAQPQKGGQPPAGSQQNTSPQSGGTGSGRG